MAEERAERRLAAILVADVVGYSRMMGEAETSRLALRVTPPVVALTVLAIRAPRKNRLRQRLSKTPVHRSESFP